MGAEDEERFERLVDWAEGRLRGREAEAVAAEAAEGDEARAALRWIRRFHQLAAGTILADPPDELHRGLVDVFRRRAEPAPPRDRGLRVPAVLAFDSWLQAAPVGVRAAAAPTGGTERHLVYTAPGYDVALDVYPGDRGRVRMEGQVLPIEDDAGAELTVRLLLGDVEVAAAAADDLGEFGLPPVPVDAYRLEVDAPALAVVVDLDLRPPTER